MAEMVLFALLVRLCERSSKKLYAITSDSTFQQVVAVTYSFDDLSHNRTSSVNKSVSAMNYHEYFLHFHSPNEESLVGRVGCFRHSKKSWNHCDGSGRASCLSNNKNINSNNDLF